MNYAIAGFIGSGITLMMMFNSMLTLRSGHLISLLVFHAVGMGAASLILFWIGNNKYPGKAPVYLYSAGMIGVLVVYFNNLSFPVLGASVTLSLVIIGQSIGSIITDSTGIFGMTKHRFEKKTMIGFLICLSGVLTMVENWSFHAAYIAMSFGTGVLVLLTMIFNSRLASYIGIFRTTRMNYIVGFVCLVPIAVLSEMNISESIRMVIQIEPIYILGGGITGVLIVAGINYVVPKLPTIYSSILMFTGQVVTGLVIDVYLGRDFTGPRMIGALLLVAGLGFNLWVKQKGESELIPNRPHPSVLPEA